MQAIQAYCNQFHTRIVVISSTPSASLGVSLQTTDYANAYIQFVPTAYSPVYGLSSSMRIPSLNGLGRRVATVSSTLPTV